VRDITEELPFEIPESWEWVRLNEIMNVVSARRVHQSDWKKSGIPFYRAREIAKLAENGFVDNELFISQEQYDNFSLNGVPHENDLMVTAVGTIGKTYVVRKNEIFYYKDASVVCFENFSNINAQYMKYLMESPYMVDQIKDNSAGTTVDTITIIKANQYLIALPPIAEQKRIVERIEELLPHIADYDVAEQKLTALNTTFPDALKKSILQAAVQGRLVEQDPADEPASALLERIRAEKSALVNAGKKKNDKLDSIIFRRDNSHYEKLGGIERCIDDEIPFDIPDSWEWCRLGSLCNYGECENEESQNIPADAWLLDLEDIEKDSGQLLQRKQKREVNSTSTKHRFTAGQVLYSKLRPYLNKVIIADATGYCTSEIVPLDFGKSIYNRFAQIYLMCPYFVEYATQCSYGVKMPRLGTQDAKKALVALPPLAEQYRIVNQIENFDPLLNSL